MKNILAITHLENDIQIDSVSAVSSSRDMRIIPICTNTVSFETIALVQKNQRISLNVKGDTFDPSCIWYATYPREDTLFSGRMQKYPYPGEYRSTVYQFMTDLRFAFEKIKFLPGNFENILKADSKPTLYRCAFEIGINVPRLTIDANLKTKKLLSKHRLYRKKLGFPAVVSYSKLTQQEEMITTINQETTKDSSCLMWQWQTPIESVAHVRGVMVGDKSWFSRWDRKSFEKSLIDYRSVESGQDTWEKASIEKCLLVKLQKLRVQLGLKICCPEFLLTPQGKFVLIDLNPCGDWYGFFDEARRIEIACAISKLF